MATNNARLVNGAIEAYNPNGIQIGGQWYNYSKYGFTCFAANQQPPLGTPVQIKLSGDSFIAALAINGVAIQPGTPPLASNFQRNGQQPAPTSPQPQQAWPSTAVQGSFPAPVTQGTPAPAVQATVTPATPVLTPLQTVVINTRLKIIDALAKAQPEYFTLDKLDEGTEVVRNWEAFVLEDLAPQPEPEEETEATDPEEEVLDDLPGL